MEEMGSTKRSIDKIFQDLQNCLIHPGDQDERRPALKRKISSMKRRPRPMEKMLKKTFAEHWVGIQNVQQKHSKNEKGINHLMKKQMKAITKKWQDELVRTKLAADEVKKETEKLKKLLKKKPVIKGQESKKFSDLQHHFINSDGYMTKIQRRNLRHTYRKYMETE